MGAKQKQHGDDARLPAVLPREDAERSGEEARDRPDQRAEAGGQGSAPKRSSSHQQNGDELREGKEGAEVWEAREASVRTGARPYPPTLHTPPTRRQDFPPLPTSTRTPRQKVRGGDS